ncbi:MAG: hypothetical protein ACLR4Z_01645 [Butyricicoccaceae bacterium]
MLASFCAVLELSQRGACHACHAGEAERPVELGRDVLCDERPQCAQERPLFRPDGGAATLHDAGDDREELCFRVIGRETAIRCAARIRRTEQRGDRPGAF